MYLIEKPCVYTKGSLKVCKSLDPYNDVENFFIVMQGQADTSNFTMHGFVYTRKNYLTAYLK